jgi:hypothetical protein
MEKSPPTKEMTDTNNYSCSRTKQLITGCDAMEGHWHSSKRTKCNGITAEFKSGHSQAG